MDNGDIWQAIEAAGPLDTYQGFDPLLVDDVIAAERATAQYDRRRAFIASFGFAVPTREAVAHIHDALVDRSVLEVCAGNGLWAKLLSDVDVCVTATDGALLAPAAHFPVEALDAEVAVQKHSDARALLLCWPPFKDDCAYRALQAFQGDRVVFIGDVRFTAESRFHALLADSWELIDKLPLPSWPGTSDAVYVYART